jgi:hypothetical protein
LLDPAGQLGNLGKLPFGFDLYQSPLKSVVVGISEGVGEIHIRFVGLDGQDFSLCGAKAIPGLTGGDRKGQVIAQATFACTAVDNQGNGASSGDFASDDPLALFRSFGEEIYNIDGAEDMGAFQTSLMNFAKLGGGEFGLFGQQVEFPKLSGCMFQSGTDSGWDLCVSV